MMLSPLYPILDSGFLPADAAAREEQLRGLMDELLAAGVTLLQYRNKSGSEAEILIDALILRAAAPVGICALILNDYPELAVEAGFDGVHVGQGDMPMEAARAIVGAERLVGVSTHNPEQLAEADRGSADYLAIGPVFATSTKLNPDPVVGIEGVRRARELTTKPLVAIGGITAENCRSVLDAGADSVAVISAIFAPGFAVGSAVATPGKIARDFFAKLR
jgi:thiamine-phosphate pyrophosphorylase